MALLGIGQNQTVNQPFQWGEGGRRLTPEDIAMRRQLAEQQQWMGSDFSPVGSVWEGLGRVVQGYTGGLNERRANRAEEANRAESQSIAELLMGQGENAPDNNAVLQALLNPYASDEVRGLAQMQFERMNTPWEPSNDFERALLASGVQPGTPEWAEANRTRTANILDPFTNLVVGGNSITGRQSMVQQALQGGGGQVSPGGPQPGTIEDGYRFNGGDPADPASWSPVMDDQQGGQALSAASQSRMITPQQAQQVRQSLGPNGQAAFEQWLRNNNITVGGQ